MTTHTRVLKRLGALACTLVLLPLSLRAQQQRQPLQELFFAQVPYLQDKGEFQLTLTHSRFPGSGVHRFETEFDVEYGISDAWQLEADAVGRTQPFSPAESHTGLQSADFSLLRGFLSRDQTFRLVIGAEVEAPVGESSDDEAGVTLGPSLSLMKDILPLHGLRVLASASLASPLSQGARRSGAETEYAVQVGAFLPVSVACLTIELSRSSEAYGSDPEPSLIAAPGIVLSLPHNFEAGMTAPVSFLHDPHRASTIFHLIYSF